MPTPHERLVRWLKAGNALEILLRQYGKYGFKSASPDMMPVHGPVRGFKPVCTMPVNPNVYRWPDWYRQ